MVGGLLWVMKKEAVYVINFLIWTYGSVLLSQSDPRVSLIPEQSEIKILGTSNISEWEEKVELFNISIGLSRGKNEVTAIHEIKASIQTRSIKSDHKRMSVKTHQALHEKEYPNIEYQLTSMEKYTSKKGQFSGTAVGNLTIAGITKTIHIPFTGTIIGNKITITGSANLNVNDFKIKPPAAMLGIIRVDHGIAVSFNLLFLMEK